MRILSVDPGVTTGYVLAGVEGSELAGTNISDIELLKAGEWRGMEELQKCLTLFENVDVVVVERYVVYPNRARQHIGSDLYTAREIGRIEWLAYLNGCEVVFQTASQAKQRFPDREWRGSLERICTSCRLTLETPYATS